MTTAGRAVPAGRLGAALSLAAAIWTLIQVSTVPKPASAHTALTKSSPSDGATLEASPAEIVLTFSEPPDAVLSTVRVVDAAGRAVEVGRADPVPGEPALRVPMPAGGLGDGAYTVTWRTTSPRDGHTTAGSVAFGVRAPVAPAGPSATVPREAPGPTLASVAGRWLFYAGVVLLLGAAVVGVAVAASPRTIAPAGLAGAWAVALAGVAVTVADKQAATGASLSQLLSSPTGAKLVVQGGAVVAAGAAVAWAGRRRDRPALVAVGVAAAAAMLARALAGHANASTPRWFAVGTHWAHLASAGAWIGGLVWVLVAMARGDPGRGPGLARRFSSVAAATLAVVLLSGGARALDEVGAWRGLVDTDFGTTLAVKLALVAVLVAVGARNRLGHVAAAAAGRIRNLSRAVRGEVALGAAVLAATAVLAGLPPSGLVAAASGGGGAAPTAGGGSAGEPTAGCGRGAPASGYQVTVHTDPDPPRAEGTTLRLTVTRAGVPLAGAEVCVRLNMPDMQHRGVSTTTVEVAPGRFEGRIVFSMTGGWAGSAVVTPPGQRAVSVPVRLQVE